MGLAKNAMAIFCLTIYLTCISIERWEFPMKKLTTLFLTLVLSLSLLTSAFGAPVRPPEEPTPTPVVTVQPGDPEKPGELPAQPQDDLPDPQPVVLD